MILLAGGIIGQVFLEQLLQVLPDATVIGDAKKIEIKAIANNSKDVQPGALFVCIRGLKVDGHQFADDALKKGAVAIICEELPELSEKPVEVLVPDSRLALGRLAAAFYGYPSDKLRLIGVTGTNGKTTTTFFIEALLSRAGRPAGIIGTIGIKIGEKMLPPHLTTPEPLELQRLLGRMADAGVKYVAMEVSSHAMALNRVEGCEFDTGIFTNLSRDHFDFHRSFDDYFRAKLKLFSSLGQSARKQGPKIAVLNADDPYSAEIAREVSGRLDRIITYGVTERADLQAEILTVSRKGSSFVMQTPAGSMVINLHLPGTVNVYNALAATAVGLSEGVGLPVIKGALEGVKRVPGRFEQVDCGQDFSVIVDFAHNPGGLHNLLKTVREYTTGRRIVVFGCKGEDPDRIKRRAMGHIVASNSDFCIITSDDPYKENPLGIAREVEEGVREASSFYEIVLDRREAINRAIEMAQPGDAVIIAGRGHEPKQHVKSGSIPFDDREIAEESLRRLVREKSVVQTPVTEP